MHAVGDVQARDARDPVEIERDEGDIVRLGEVAIDLPELLGIHRTEIRRRFHAGQHDRDPSRACASDDLGQVPLQRGNRDTAKTVVGAELDHQNPHIPFERPVEAAQTASRRVPRHSCVDDLVRVPVGPQPRLDQRRNRFFFRESVACGETVAEKDDARPRRRGALGRVRVSSRTNLGRRLPLRAGGVHKCREPDEEYREPHQKPCFHYVIRRTHGCSVRCLSPEHVHDRAGAARTTPSTARMPASTSSDSPRRSGANVSTSGRPIPRFTR